VRRLPAIRLVLLVLAASACLAAPMNAAAATIVLDDPITDNYKAAYNADPSKPELRTWLAMRSITVEGVVWRPVAPSAIQIFSGGIDVVAADGRTGTLRAAVASGPLVASPLMRSDPLASPSVGRWGILATVSDRTALRTTSGVVNLTLSIAGATIATGVVSYRYDAKLAGAPSSNIEYNGPGGRWWVGSVATRTQEEPAPLVPPSVPAGTSGLPAGRPVITRVQLPLRTTNRAVTMRVTARRAAAPVTRIRVRIGSGRWGRWTRVAPSYRLVLPPGNRTHRVTIQVRDSNGFASPLVARRITCACG
jgi:hypothetical protein